MRLIRPEVTIEEALKEPWKWIPEGIYCYKWNEDGDIFNSTGYLCPFWDCDCDKPELECGYCHYLKCGDWEAEHVSLLWDMCKECAVNEDDEYC